MNVIIVAVVVGIISSLITVKIITARYINQLSGYTENNLKETKEFMDWFISLLTQGKKS